MDFVQQQRHLRDSEMRAAAFATEYATWRREHHRYPIHFPEFAKKAVPISCGDVTRRMEAAASRPGYGFMVDCIGHELGRGKHPEHARFCAVHQRALTQRWHHTAERNPGIEFEEDTWITRASEHSIFGGVLRDKAEEILLLAEPKHWCRAAPAFFLESSPGAWDPYVEKFHVEKGRNGNGARDFQLHERVEWNYTPETVGGASNVLLITNFQRVHSRTVLKLSYEYSLHRCLATKFVTSWEEGGIDVDEGYYDAEWSASSRKLIIKAEKRVRYSREEEQLVGLSTTLNLLAPALIGMLMGHLAFYGVRDRLEQQSA